MSIPTLYPFQVDLFNRVRAARLAGKRIIVVQGATGSGKNTWGAYVVKQAVDKGSYCLCMVHRRRLVDQISDRLQQFEVDHGILMRGEKPDPRYRVQVASRDTLLSRCVNNEWMGMPPASLIIVDEAHHAANPSSEYRRILELYPQATILLLTATPVGPDGQGLGPWAQAIECAAPTTQLVHDGFLVPLKVYAPDRKKVKGRYVRGIAGDLVQSWKDYGEDRPTVLFTNRVKHSQDAVAAFKAEGISAEHVDADTDDESRDRIFDDVAAGRTKILSNVGIVGEGVDVPELTCCQLYLDLGSRTKLLQATGRVMRPAPGKAHGILIDHSGAVFRYGFPDEDTEWTLNGNVDEEFKAKHKAGQTEKAFYCKACELAYHGQEQCPQCGRSPSKPPKSIFAPPPIRSRDELLTEADRDQEARVHNPEEKERHWLRCLGVAKSRNGTFGMAAQIYKRKYNEWPGDGFPAMPERWQWKSKVADIFPNFGQKIQRA